MAVYEIDPEKIMTYGTGASRAFDDVSERMRAWVKAVEDADYKGKNAAEFRQNVFNWTANAAREMNKDLPPMARSISDFLGSLTQRLGATPPQPTFSEIALPGAGNAGEAGGVQRGETDSLASMSNTVKSCADAIVSALNSHVSAYDSIGYSHPQKGEVDDVVHSGTTKINASVTENVELIVKYVTDQIKALDESKITIQGA